MKRKFLYSRIWIYYVLRVTFFLPIRERPNSTFLLFVSFNYYYEIYFLELKIKKKIASSLNRIVYHL